MSDNNTAAAATENVEPKIVWPSTMIVKEQELQVKIDPVSKERYVEYRDEKLGEEIKLWFRNFAKGDKAGCKFVVPEYPNHQSVLEKYGADVVTDIVNAWIAQKLATKCTAQFASKTNPKLVSEAQRKVYLDQLEAKDFWIGDADDALDYVPFERGESMSGLQREQRQLQSQLAEAQKAGDPKKMQETMQKLLESMQRMQAFLQRQASEYQDQLSAIENLPE